MAIDERLVDVIAKAMCDGRWDAVHFNETLNGEEPEDQREYWRIRARAAIIAYEAAKPVAETHCLVTGNPVGTDTWQVGHPCRCANCSTLAKPVAGDVVLKEGWLARDVAKAAERVRQWSSPVAPTNTSGEMVEAATRIISGVMDRDNHALALQTAQQILALYAATDTRPAPAEGDQP